MDVKPLKTLDDEALDLIWGSVKGTFGRDAKLRIAMAVEKSARKGKPVSAPENVVCVGWDAQFSGGAYAHLYTDGTALYVRSSTMDGHEWWYPVDASNWKPAYKRAAEILIAAYADIATD